MVYLIALPGNFERQPYYDHGELLHLATQAEHHIKRKLASTNQAKPTARSIDKGNDLNVESRFKNQAHEPLNQLD